MTHRLGGFRRASVALAALSLIVAACGGDDDDSSDPSVSDPPAAAATTPAPSDSRPAPTTPGDATATSTPESDADALAQAFADDILSDDEPMTEVPDEARCVGDGIVSGLGVERLTELGVTADDIGQMDDYDFTEAEIEVIVDSMYACVDVNAALVASFGAGLPPEQADCMGAALDDETVRAAMTASMGTSEPPPEFINAMLAAMAECGALAPLLAPQFAQMGIDETQAQCVAESLDVETLVAMAELSQSGMGDTPPELMEAVFAAFDDCGALVPLLADELATSMEIDHTRATCVAEQLGPDVMVAMVQTDETGEAPSDATLFAVVDAMVGCDAIQDALAQQFVDEEDLDRETADCVVAALDEEAWRGMFVAGMSDDDDPPADVVAAFEVALASCGITVPDSTTG